MHRTSAGDCDRITKVVTRNNLPGTVAKVDGVQKPGLTGLQVRCQFRSDLSVGFVLPQFELWCLETQGTGCHSF